MTFDLAAEAAAAFDNDDTVPQRALFDDNEDHQQVHALPKRARMRGEQLAVAVYDTSALARRSLQDDARWWLE